MQDHPQLKLKNQLCFPLYAAHRLVTQHYQPLLAELDLTYPQYLILLVLWEEDGQTVTSIGKKLLLSTNTLTPLLKRLESKDIVIRQKSEQDERRVIVSLTEDGRNLKEKALSIPEKLIGNLGTDFTLEEARALKVSLERLVVSLSK